MEITLHELVTAQPGWTITLVTMTVLKPHCWNVSDTNGLHVATKTTF
jgi:hypothetical protein